jgi:L-seryl-tRNA(Ser) seleniumtransferase
MKDKAKKTARDLPSVSALLEMPVATDMVVQHGRTAVVEAVRKVLADLRSEIVSGGSIETAACEASAILRKVDMAMQYAGRARLRRVVNASGIILHTGLGRAVMPYTVKETLPGLMTGCCNVQMDLKTGQRMRREDCVIDMVRELTGAEEALVVNNNAGATLLVLRALAEKKEVVVSRGEMIEIGGSFRLPDIMSESGAVLKEVGATNKTHARDYENAIGPQTGLLLKAHKSNYGIVGFTSEVGIGEIAEIGRRHGIPVVDDIGCGALVDLAQYGLEHEMTMRESLEAGADIVLSSTDKLIGGPQGGLIIGRKDLLDRVRSHPLYRALRVCKMTLAALEATLRVFREPEFLVERHPLYGMIGGSLADLETRAKDVARRISESRSDWIVAVTETSSKLGGGAAPLSEIPSFAVSINSSAQSASEIALEFRTAEPPVIARVKEDTVLLDMRTVSKEEVDDVVRACSRNAE